ncbi:hypothetical protein ACP4OV_016691 [Aristida adscensionis]
MAPKKLPAFTRVWTPADELRILEGLAAHTEDHRAPPGRSQLCDLFRPLGLDRADFTLIEIYEKVRSLRDKYFKLRAAGAPPLPPAAAAAAPDADRKFLLSHAIWANHSGPAPKVAAKKTRRPANAAAADTANAAAADTAKRQPRPLEELQRLYPSLSMAIDRIVTPQTESTVKRAFRLIGDDEARRLDARAKKQRLEEAKVTAQRVGVRNEVLTTLTQSMD